MHKRYGFSGIEVILVLAIIAAVGGVAWFGLRGNNAKDSSAITNAKAVTWSFNGTAWEASGKPPACSSPIRFSQAPSDLSKATAVLYPGQTRGGNYKPHGGLRYPDGQNNVTVKAIYDGRVTEGARYIEAGEVQYLFTIVNDCGIAYRFDHLQTLSPKFQAMADKLPAAQPNESRTTRFDDPLEVKAGEIVATAVGFPKMRNASYDLGVYDLRSTNQAAQSAEYRAKHQPWLNQAAYAVCWIDMFSASDNAILASLPGGDMVSGKQSDYCK